MKRKKILLIAIFTIILLFIFYILNIIYEYERRMSRIPYIKDQACLSVIRDYYLEFIDENNGKYPSTLDELRSWASKTNRGNIYNTMWTAPGWKNGNDINWIFFSPVKNYLIASPGVCNIYHEIKNARLVLNSNFKVVVIPNDEFEKNR
jgi:hypothetical protein